MWRRTDAGAALSLLVALALPGCGPRGPAGTPQDVAVGHHRVRFVVPKGWEHLDHGREQLFRLDEAQLSLVDLGPVTRDGMVTELKAAKGTWLAGYRRDAFERVRELRSPALRYAMGRESADFWKPWTDVAYTPAAADSGDIGPAFDALIRGTESLVQPTPDLVFQYVTDLSMHTQGREISAREQPKVHGWVWFEYETWNRTTHMDRSRLAFLENNGFLLVLRMDRGLFETTAPAFDAVLGSIEVTPGPPILE